MKLPSNRVHAHVAQIVENGARFRTTILAMTKSTTDPPSATGNSNAELVGTWKLVSASSVTSKGKRNETPYGVGPVGFLSYSEDGRVTALISYGGRKPLGAIPQVEEQAEAFKTFFAYSGRYTLSEDKVIHHIEICSIQNYVDKDLIRSLIVEGDQIKLITPPAPVNGTLQSVELIWQRLPIGS
jgi:Lipocalin-like domain